jgi:hypothetical protein
VGLGLATARYSVQRIDGGFGLVGTRRGGNRNVVSTNARPSRKPDLVREGLEDGVAPEPLRR